MKRLTILFLALLSAQFVYAETASDVITKVESITRGNTAYARLEIEIKRSRLNKTIAVDSWDDRKKDRSFVRVLKPKKDYGTTFLKDGNNLWQYIPEIGKEIKIEGSMMGDSWMGSDFSNDDLVKSSSYEEDYNHRFLTNDSKSNYKIELKPKPGAPVIWARIVAEIQRNDYMPVRYDFYDHKGRLKKSMKFSDYKQMGGRKIPTRLEMATIVNGTARSTTTLIYKSAAFDRPISASVFSKANMRR